MTLSHHPLCSACIILFLWYKPRHKALLISILIPLSQYTAETVIYYPPHFQQRPKCLGDRIYLIHVWLMKELHDFINWYQIDGFSWIFIDNQHSFYELLASASQLAYGIIWKPVHYIKFHTCLYFFAFIRRNGDSNVLLLRGNEEHFQNLPPPGLHILFSNSISIIFLHHLPFLLL